MSWVWCNWNGVPKGKNIFFLCFKLVLIFKKSDHNEHSMKIKTMCQKVSRYLKKKKKVLRTFAHISWPLYIRVQCMILGIQLSITITLHLQTEQLWQSELTFLPVIQAHWTKYVIFGVLLFTCGLLMRTIICTQIMITPPPRNLEFSFHK